MKQATTQLDASSMASFKLTRRKLFASVGIALLSFPLLSEAKLGAHRTKSYFGQNRVRGSKGLVDPYGETITSNSFFEVPGEYEIEASSTTTTTTSKRQQQQQKFQTDVGDLAKSFQEALVAMNQNEEDIHVGRLLLASERLESTMRKIGFSQSANDIHGNVAKIRSAYDSAPKNQRDSMPALLRYEIASGVLKGKKIPEKSAAMGFLWLGRSLNYQFDMFSHMLDHNAEPYEAAMYAYNRDLKPHLSWPLQKMGQAAMSTMLKSRRQKEMFARIGGFSEETFGTCEEQATKQELRQVMGHIQPMLSRWKKVFSELDLGCI